MPLISFVKLFSLLGVVLVLICSGADIYLLFTSEIQRNPHLFTTSDTRMKYFFQCFGLLGMPVLVYAIGQLLLTNRIWVSVLGLLSAFVCGYITYGVYFIGGDPSIGMLLGINIVLYWMLGTVTLLAFLIKLGQR